MLLLGKSEVLIFLKLVSSKIWSLLNWDFSSFDLYMVLLVLWVMISFVTWRCSMILPARVVLVCKFCCHFIRYMKYGDVVEVSAICWNCINVMGAAVLVRIWCGFRSPFGLKLYILVLLYVNSWSGQFGIIW